MQNTYQEKILDIETTNNSIKKKLEGGIKFKIKSDFQPAGDQPQAIKSITQNIKNKKNEQVLLGVTGSGKTFTMAKVIEATNRPALVLAPNKTLAAQLYGEFKSFFPDNAVEYFVSYYDYYTPEAYVPRSDTYIEKEASINEQIDRMRHSATRSLLERDDVIIVASVSCIYGSFFLNISIRPRNISLWCIIVIVRNKIFNRIIWKKTFKLSIKLSR